MRVKRVVLGATVTVAAILLICVGGLMWTWHRFPHHEHCIKQTGTWFALYADAHGNQFPTSSNGFGDASVLLVRDTESNDPDSIIPFITSVSDDGRFFRMALTNGGHLAESNCSRIYVQGLSPEMDGVAMIFDAYPTHGGDHFRRPWGPLTREVLFADRSDVFMKEANWPEFSKKQIELLVKNGIPRARAEEYYRLASIKPPMY